MKRLVRFRYCTIFFTSPSSSSSRSNSFIIDYDGGNNLIDSYCYYHHIMGKNQLKLPEVIEILYGDSLYESIFHSFMVRVSRIPFRTSSRHAFLINRLFKHHLMEFKKKNWKLIFKKQCKRAKTIFQPAQGSKWASLADHFQDFTLLRRQMPSNYHMFERHYRIVS